MYSIITVPNVKKHQLPANGHNYSRVEYNHKHYIPSFVKKQ